MYDNKTIKILSFGTVRHEQSVQTQIGWLLQKTHWAIYEIMVFFVLRKTHYSNDMRSHPVGLDLFLVGPFFYFRTSCVRIAKALVRLRWCAGSLEPSLVAYVISTIISWAGPIKVCLFCSFKKGSCQLLAKECALSTGKLPRRLA